MPRKNGAKGEEDGDVEQIVDSFGEMRVQFFIAECAVAPKNRSGKEAGKELIGANQGDLRESVSDDSEEADKRLTAPIVRIAKLTVYTSELSLSTHSYFLPYSKLLRNTQPVVHPTKIANKSSNSKPSRKYVRAASFVDPDVRIVSGRRKYGVAAPSLIPDSVRRRYRT